MPSRGARLSVCLSVTFVYSLEMNKHIFYFSLSGSHTILVFRTQTLWRTLTGVLLTGASNAGGAIGVSFYRAARLGGSLRLWAGQAKSRLSGFIACCERCDRQVLYIATPDRRKLVTLVAGKRRRLLFYCSRETVFMTRSLNYAEENKQSRNN